MKKSIQILILCFSSFIFLFFAISFCNELEIQNKEKKTVTYKMLQEEEKLKYYKSLTEMNEKQKVYYELQIKELRK